MFIFSWLFLLRGYGQEDSLFIFKDTSNINYNKPPYLPVTPTKKTTNIYDSIARFILPFDSVYIRKSKKYDLRNEIKNKIYVPQQKMDISQQNIEISYDNALKNFVPYQGKTIRNIYFKELEVFGQNLTDTSAIPDTWFEKLVNGLHIKTQKQFLSNRLLFKKGDKLDPLILADNERVIRSMPNIQDVRILVKESAVSADSVDVLLITKDVLPVGFGIELFDLNTGQAGVWNKNLLGMGHELYYNLLWDLQHSPNYGHKLRYRINSIGNTFVSADASYENQWNIESYKIYFNRAFFTPQIKYAGGFGFEKNRLIRNITIVDTVFVDRTIKYDFIDTWLGRSIILPKNKNLLVRRNISLTGRLMNYKFSERPPVTENMFYDYYSRTDFLGSIDISRQAFLKSHHIYGFGKLEDVPYGSLVKITAGYEINEFKSWPYFGVHLSSAYYIKKLGYLYESIDFGSFFEPGIKQGVLSFSGQYFTPLLNSNRRYKYRIFANVNYIRGFNRFDGEYVELSNNNGIRGLTSQNLRGNERFFFRIENTCYSPQTIYGFHLAYFLFYDAGLIANSDNKLFYNPLYSGLGVGVRIRNENLVFNTILIRLSYYPRLPDVYSARYFDISGVSIPDYPSFENKQPEILKFGN